ncbi:MFS transporter [Stackebrandtia nassauensis]|uniref:Major facilitator transporter n=1 Tax=Stackebrandtia nassauensis (strain DSM 44728 / CIP 108903 / NRRL B-16338 / NBRC 102104 / LLR-40K-21) TaxID=446470 RepID=D3PYL7_STANL|nr:MFS transporter [Stackebrandtia nassauensis]ADD43450.1 major facilitator transporter [Stackebrandtia nassauensis DSM 44728]
MIAARVVQGGFGALLFVLMPVLASAAVRPQLRGRAMGWMFAIGPLGAIAGTAAVGVMIDNIGWSSIFLPHLPLAAEGRYAWLAVALLAIPPVLAWRRMESGRLVLSLLRVPGVRAPMTALWTQVTGQLAVSFLVPFYIQRYLDADSALAGLVLLVLPAGMVLFSPLGGWLTDNWGARRTAILGLAVPLAATGSMAWFGETWTIADLAWRLGLLGVGAGLFTGAQTAMAMAAAPADMMGSVSAALSFARQLGLGTAPALATILWGLTGYGLAGMRLAIAVITALGLGGLYALWRARTVAPLPTAPEPARGRAA